MYSREEITKNQHLYDATEDVLAAAVFLKARGVTPPEGWIQSQIRTLSTIYKAARSPEQAEHLVRKFTKPIDSGAEDVKKLLSIGVGVPQGYNHEHTCQKTT